MVVQYFQAGNTDMKEWVSTGDYGLRYREHQTRTTGIGRNKRPIRYFVSVYKWQNKTVTDAYGWEGADFKGYDDIVQTALQLKQNRRNQTPPFTLRELLDTREEHNKAIEEARLIEAIRLEEKQATILDNVFAEYCDAKSDKKSLVDEENYYKNWIAPNIGKKLLNEIILLDLERISKKMHEAGRAARSIQYVKSIIRQVFHFAADRGLFSGDPPTINFLKNQKIDNKRLRYLSPEEADLLLNEIRKHSEQTYRISLLSLNSAMRFGEIAALCWQHINLDRREITILDAKNGQSRSVYMTDIILKMFSAMKQGKTDDLVFPARISVADGEHAKPMISVSNVFDKAVKNLGLNDGITDRRMKVVFHSLRHSCASWLVNAGVELPVIAKILGHKTLAMTMRYSHVNDQSVRSAMQKIDHQQGNLDKIHDIQQIKQG